MSNFKLTSNEKEKGKVVYNVGILRNIVTLAVAEVEGTVPSEQNKKQPPENSILRGFSFAIKETAERCSAFCHKVRSSEL